MAFLDSTRTGTNLGGGLPRCTVAMPRGLNYATGGEEQRPNAVNAFAADLLVSYTTLVGISGEPELCPRALAAALSTIFECRFDGKRTS